VLIHRRCRFLRPFFLVLIAVALCGCDQPSSSAPVTTPKARPSVPSDPQINQFLLDALHNHHFAAHIDGPWVVLDCAPICMNGEISSKSQQGRIVQLGMRLLLPDGRTIQQPVVGFAEDEQRAIDSAKASFMLGTLHAWFGAFVDPQDEHVAYETRDIGGWKRIITWGDVVGKSMGTTQPSFDNRWRDQLVKEIDAARLSPGTHWIDVYNGMIKENQELEIQLDNQRWTDMEAKMRKAPWPTNGYFTSVRVFLIVQDVGDPTRPTTRPATMPSTQPATARAHHA
jgi:hypothetical protein